jgi:glycosyltransferase involved in cell wall biosynthesis
MIRISVVIITYNEERNLARCLDSIKDIADEIVVVDSNSTDNTIAIASTYNARVIQHPFLGYGEQKNFATKQACNDWILSLDADEALTPDLRQSIREIKNGPEFMVYQMSRLTNYCGKWIRHCGWYPDKQTRLYNRTMGKWEEKKVHEYWRLDEDEKEKYGNLKGDLLHYSFRSINEHLTKIEKYSELAARESVENGRNATLFKIYFSPKWHFINEFIIQLGFLDGFYGYTICRLSVYATFLKYSKIRLYYSQKHKNTAIA